MGWMSVLEKELWTGFFALVLLILSIVLIRFFYRILKVRGDREHALRIVNQGNIGSIYSLSLDSAASALSFKLFYNHIPLVEAPEPEPVELAPIVETAPIAPQPKKPLKRGKKRQPAPKSTQSDVVAEASDKGRAVGQQAGKAASLLGALGSLLPGKLGQNFTQQSAAAREVQAEAVKAGQAPSIAQRRVDSVKSASDDLAGQSQNQQAASPSSSSAPVDAGAIGPAPVEEGTATGVQEAAPQPSQRKRSKEVSAPGRNRQYRVHTQEIGPGESITLRLRIGSRTRRYPTGSFSYRIASQPVPLDPDETNAIIPPVSKQGIVHFESIGAWRYWLPFLASLTVVITTFLTFIYILSVIW